MTDITGVILAGGDNRRFPVNKGLLRVGEERIIDRTLRLFREIFVEVIISTNTPEYYFFSGERMIGDLFPSRGPMGGIFSALVNSRTDRIFVAACDMPFLNPSLIRYLSGISTNADMVVCSFREGLHPLLGLYGKGILSPLETHLREGAIGLQRFIRDLNAHIVEEEEIKKIDPEGVSFVNINTIGDFNKFIGGKICLG
ncbi:MAG: molybdenum cofactor guanylyltransferase [Nitrospirota bacterium]|nr:molybdenum cofactor guanylyltransferase [Nitrospirota bacterium]